MKHKNVPVILFILYIIFSFPVISVAQQSGAALRQQESQRELADEATRQLSETEREPIKEENFTFDYGAWVYGYYINYKDIDNDSGVEDWVKDSYVVDTRVWAQSTFYRVLTLYGRMRNTYIWRPNVSSDYTGIGDDFEGPIIDILYADINLKPRYKIPFSVRAGRQYLTIGKGITYSDIHDGVQFRYEFGDLKSKVFLSKTQRYEDNIDYSVPGYKDEGDRDFYGVELAYVFPGAVLYGYVLVERDQSSECPEDLTQNYSYNSEYIGLGIDGRIKNFYYWAEGIKEYGKSNTDATKTELDEKAIDAWAFDVGAKYIFDVYSHPLVEAEIAYGSGDKDRTSVTNTSGGNTGGKDTNFLYFGIFEGGYALAPRLSNMFIYKIEMACKPLEAIPYLGKNLAVGTKFYIYSKAERSGGIYDVDATEASSDIGQEIDFFIHWKVYENLYATLRYGMFFPGAAYPRGRRDTSEYFLARLRMTF